MFDDIQEFVKSCDICSKMGEKLVNTNNKVIETNKPNEIWEVDLIGRIVDGVKVSKFIFVAIDHRTKWVETATLEHKSASGVAQLIEELIMKIMGRRER